MAYQSPYGTNSYTRETFGRRHYGGDVAAPRGVSRSLFFSTLCAAILFALWSGVTTFYLLFQDDVLQTLASRQLETTRASDAQHAALSTELDRIRSTKFVDQEKIEQQLSDLLRIQRLIEVRHNALAALAKAVAQKQDITGSLPVPAPARSTPAPDERTLPEAKPRPLSDTILVDPPRTNSAALHSRMYVPRAAAVTPGSGKQQRDLVSVERTLARLGAEQAQALNAIEADLDQRAERTKKAIAALGPRLPATARTQEPPAGGPFIPYTAANVPEDAFMRQVFRIRLATAEQERLSRQLEGLPVLLPVLGPAEITSGFGPRVDPFLRRLAMHVGVDIRGDSGDPVRASAPGTVIAAERHKAYGLMVEIDHGNGFSTRYAHLSAILVKEGASVVAGAVVGKIGSTGRSTAPHLHYEVRINGDAVDPRRYLRAGKQLAGFH